jgi:hypothetical protein
MWKCQKESWLLLEQDGQYLPSLQDNISHFHYVVVKLQRVLSKAHPRLDFAEEQIEDAAWSEENNLSQMPAVTTKMLTPTSEACLREDTLTRVGANDESWRGKADMDDGHKWQWNERTAKRRGSKLASHHWNNNEMPKTLACTGFRFRLVAVGLELQAFKGQDNKLVAVETPLFDYFSQYSWNHILVLGHVWISS